ncbi:MAG: hypothetical protein H6738_10690 [Alphaproteobacteria bacterium]|nr:hypothetical protein [Alphaproteobacteria bacterium]MCB9697237.1 hypothetical protein [Alphaproteobacteria bacterium]
MWWWGVAFAQDAGESKGPSVTFTNDIELRYWQVDQRLPDPDDVPVFDYWEQVDRLNTVVSEGIFTASLQLDQVALWANRYYLDDVLYVERELVTPGTPTPFPSGVDVYLNPEKVSGRFELEHATIVIGDAYTAFGRGLALNLNRNVDIDIDTSLQGVKAVVRPGAWDLTAVVATANRQQVFQDNPNIGIYGDLRHRVAGVRAERFGLGPANVGAHGVVYDFVETTGFASLTDDPVAADAIVGGATTELIGVAGIDWFVEGDVYSYSHDLALPDTSPIGYAGYLSASGYPGPFVILVEGKRYLGVERVNSKLTPELYEVSVGPTLEYERVILEDTSAAVNSNDIWGARVQVDWAAVPGKLVPYVALATFRDLDTTGLHFNDVPETIGHVTTGLEYIDGDRAVLFNTGFRVDDRDGNTDGADRLAHADLSTNFPLPGGLLAYISAASRYFAWGINGDLQQAPFGDAESSWGLTKGMVTGTVSLDWTANPLVRSTGNVSDSVYMGGELQVKPARAWTMKAFYGAQKAGIRCSGGQCRTLPGFEGLRLSAVGTF